MLTVLLSSLRHILTLVGFFAHRGNRPSEVELAKWLPVFIDGVREYQEPYRFLAIRGSQELVAEAGPKLYQFATELVSVRMCRTRCVYRTGGVGGWDVVRIHERRLPGCSEGTDPEESWSDATVVRE